MSSVRPARVVLLRRLVVLATILVLVLPALGAAAVSADEKIGSNEVSVHSTKTVVNTVEASPISVGLPTILPTRSSECPSTDQTSAVPVQPQEAPEHEHQVKYPRLHLRFGPLKVRSRPGTRPQPPVETSRPDWGRAAPDFRIRLRSRQKIRRHNLLSSSKQLRQRPTTETAHLRKDTETTMIPVIPVLLAATPVTAPAAATGRRHRVTRAAVRNTYSSNLAGITASTSARSG